MPRWQVIRLVPIPDPRSPIPDHLYSWHFMIMPQSSKQSQSSKQAQSSKRGSKKLEKLRVAAKEAMCAPSSFGAAVVVEGGVDAALPPVPSNFGKTVQNHLKSSRKGELLMCVLSISMLMGATFMEVNKEGIPHINFNPDAIIKYSKAPPPPDARFGYDSADLDAHRREDGYTDDSDDSADDEDLQSAKRGDFGGTPSTVTHVFTSTVSPVYEPQSPSALAPTLDLRHAPLPPVHPEVSRPSLLQKSASFNLPGVLFADPKKNPAGPKGKGKRAASQAADNAPAAKKQTPVPESEIHSLEEDSDLNSRSSDDPVTGPSDDDDAPKTAPKKRGRGQPGSQKKTKKKAKRSPAGEKKGDSIGNIEGCPARTEKGHQSDQYNNFKTLCVTGDEKLTKAVASQGGVTVPRFKVVSLDEESYNKAFLIMSSMDDREKIGADHLVERLQNVEPPPPPNDEEEEEGDDEEAGPGSHGKRAKGKAKDKMRSVLVEDMKETMKLPSGELKFFLKSVTDDLYVHKYEAFKIKDEVDNVALLPKAQQWELVTKMALSAVRTVE
eukprot:gene22095-biopygen30784